MRGTLASVTMLAVVGIMIWLGATAYDALRTLPDRRALERAAETASDELGLARIGTIAERRPREVIVDEEGVRYVDRAGIVAPRVGGELVREPISVPYGPPAQPPRAPDEHRLVVIESAGVIDARSRRIHLEHVKGPEADASCRTEAGVTWPCGRRARTAFRRFVRRRSIFCLDETIVRGAERETVVASCKVGETDLSRWLIEQGWAEPTEEAPEEFVTAHARARNFGLGLYNPSPR